MSPASYQTAPPRARIVAVTRKPGQYSPAALDRTPLHPGCTSQSILQPRPAAIATRWLIRAILQYLTCSYLTYKRTACVRVGLLPFTCHLQRSAPAAQCPADFLIFRPWHTTQFPSQPRPGGRNSDIMNNVFERIGKFLALHNISIYGAAPSSLLETEPAGYRPSDLLSDCQSLFCIGVEVPRGVLHIGPRAETTYWRIANVIYRYLDAILTRCAAMLEGEGKLAVPVFGCFPYDVKGKGDFWGYVSLGKMSEVSGLGKLGKNGLLINSKAGPRLLLGGIVTTARLPAMTSCGRQETGCPKDCHVCQDACPVKAIERNGKVDRGKCVRHSMRSPLFSHLLKSGEVREADVGMLNQVSGVDDHSMYMCIACVAACPLGDRSAGQPAMSTAPGRS